VQAAKRKTAAVSSARPFLRRATIRFPSPATA
jgi:hypothetical protein